MHKIQAPIALSYSRILSVHKSVI